MHSYAAIRDAAIFLPWNGRMSQGPEQRFLPSPTCSFDPGENGTGVIFPLCLRPPRVRGRPCPVAYFADRPSASSPLRFRIG